MPLNIKEEKETTEGIAPPAPILRKPQEVHPAKKYGVMAFLVIALIASIIFLVYIFTYADGRKQLAQETIVPATIETNVAHTAPATEVVKPSIAPQVSKPQPKTPDVSKYAIYIGTYSKKQTAEEEVRRWINAGYKAFVVESSKYFQVALGEYETETDARRDAVKLSDAFERGYWVGRIQ